MLTNQEDRMMFFKILFFILNGGLTIFTIIYSEKENPSAGPVILCILLSILWFVFFLFSLRHPCPSCNRWYAGECIGETWLSETIYKKDYMCLCCGHKWNGKEKEVKEVGDMGAW